MTIIINKSLASGVIPAFLKCAIVKPIAKVPCPKDPSEYRPVSMLSPIAKILETVVLEYWIKPLITEEMFADQFGFVPLPNKGTTVALTSIIGDILQHTDVQGAARLLFVDFSKAFDRIEASKVISVMVRSGASKECMT